MKFFLRPVDIHARQKDKKLFPNSVFDSSRTFQCKRCGGAARLVARMENDVRELSTEGGRLNPEKSEAEINSVDFCANITLREAHSLKQPAKAKN